MIDSFLSNLICKSLKTNEKVMTKLRIFDSMKIVSFKDNRDKINDS
jgi:hypothetical protein